MWSNIFTGCLEKHVNSFPLWSQHALVQGCMRSLITPTPSPSPHPAPPPASTHSPTTSLHTQPHNQPPHPYSAPYPHPAPSPTLTPSPAPTHRMHTPLCMRSFILMLRFTQPPWVHFCHTASHQKLEGAQDDSLLFPSPPHSWHTPPRLARWLARSQGMSRPNWLPMTRRCTKLPSHELVQGVACSHQSGLVALWQCSTSCRYSSMFPWYVHTCIFKICDQHWELEMVGLTPSPVLYRPGYVYIRAEMKVIISPSNLCLHNIQSHQTFFNCTHRKYNRVQQNESSIICFLLALGL